MTYSIIQKSQLEGANRIDAEYYQMKYLDIYRKLSELKTITLSEFCRIADGDHSKIPGFVESDGIRYLRAKDLHRFFIDDSDSVFISKDYFQKIKRSHIKPLDIVLSIMGTVGNLAIILSEYGKITANRAVSIISPKSQEKFSSYFLVVYLESKFGVMQRERESMGGVQQRVNLDDLANIRVPIISKEKQQQVVLIFEKALQENNNSKTFYSRAENLLLEELGLSSFAKASEDEERFYIVNFSEIKSENRMDAEYFQPKYEKLISKLKSKNSKKLVDFVKDYSTGFPFKSENYQEEGIPLIRINNIKKGFLDLSDTTYLSERDFLLSPKDTAISGDIVLSMSGSIGITAIIPDNIPKCSINQRILRFSVKNINKEYLTLVLNSVVGNLQLKRLGTGGVQTNISYKDIKNILIPYLTDSTQQKIAELVRKSHEARKRSKELLEEAKKTVEEMIEKGGERNE